MNQAGQIAVEWCDYLMNHERHVVRTTGEAIALFKSADAKGSPVLVDFVLPGGQMLTVGAGGPFTVMCFQASADPPYLVAIGGRLPHDHLESFSYGGSDTEFQGDRLLATGQAADAIEEFIATGEPPTTLVWVDA